MEYIEYLKAVISAILVGLSAPLPVSSSAHMFLSEAFLGGYGDRSALGFYFYIYMLTFSVVVLLSFKNSYIKTLKGIRDKDETCVHKGINLILSLSISLVLFIPVFNKSGLIGFFDSFMSVENALNPILIGIGSVSSGLILLVCLWASGKNYVKKGCNIDRKTALKASLFSLPSYIIPGFSRVSAACVSFILSDTAPARSLRECYFYIAPQMLLVSVIRIITFAIKGISFDPVVLLAGIIFVSCFNFIVLNLLKRISVKKIFSFCGAYSVVIGIIVAASGLI